MSSRSGIKDLLIRIGTGDSNPKEVVTIPLDHVEPRVDDFPINHAGTGYYRIWVTSSYLQHDQVLHQKYFSAVVANVEFSYGDDSMEVSSVVSPLNAVEGLGKEDAGDVTIKDQVLTPLVPFSGGTIRIAVALRAVESKDMLKAFVEAMGDISKVVTWNPLSTVTAAIDPINDGISKLFGLDRDNHITGFSETFSVDHNPLHPGFIACFDAPEGSVSTDNLWVKDGVLYNGYIDDEHAQPYRAHDYILLRVETLRFRNDWRNVGTINDLFQEAITLVGESQTETDSQTADGKIRQAILEAFRSPDLTSDQRDCVALGLRDEYLRNKGTLQQPIEATSPPSTDDADSPSNTFEYPSSESWRSLLPRLAINRESAGDIPDSQLPEIPELERPTLKQLLSV